MKNTKILAVALVAALGFSACAKDNGQTVDTGSKGSGIVEIKFNSKTRAEGNSHTDDQKGIGVENEVNMVEFFSFVAATGAPTADGAYYRATPADLTSAISYIVSAGSNTFLVAVNANIFADVDAYEASTGGKTYTAIKALVASRENTLDNSMTAPAPGTGFLMSAEGGATVTAGETNALTLTLERALSKVEAPKATATTVGATLPTNADALKTLFAVNINEAGVSVKDLEWVFDGYVLINGIRNSYDFRYVNWNGWTAPFMNPATAADWNKTEYTDDTGVTIKTVYAGDKVATDKFITATDQVIYVYENKPTRIEGVGGAATVYEMDETTSFLIKGHFTANVDNGSGAVAADSPARYWRIDLLKADSWEIYRNSIYRVTLNTVDTEGWGTPKDAEEKSGPIVDPQESAISITLEIADWYIRTENVDF